MSVIAPHDSRDRLITVAEASDILPRYRGTPIEELLQYQNLGMAMPASVERARLFITMCIDYRKELRVPNQFAFVMRTAAGRLHGNEWELAFAVGIGGLGTVALLGHNDCAMMHVTEKEDHFVQGLVERGGCEPWAARMLFEANANEHEIFDPVSFVLEQARHVRQVYPKLLVAPLLYDVFTDRLLQVVE